MNRYILIIVVTMLSFVTKTKADNLPTLAWPNLPLINIVTQDSVMPTCTIATPPEGAIGIGITNNNHVPGRMVISLKGDTLYDSGEYIKGESGMRIKVRGNTTGVYLDQHPYKIKLSKKADLLMRDKKKYKHKDWALLSMYTWNPVLTNSESNTTTLFGLELARVAGMEWEPQTEFVNVILNGKYQGLYYLIETVDKGETRVNIDDTGLLIENDAYWWNEDGKFFKTNHQSDKQGYTYKYPDADDVNDSIQEELKSYINKIEDHIWTGDDLAAYIDYASFATWVLCHDILGTYDLYGSNIYYHKKDLDKNNLKSSPLMMGPLWDFDSSFRNDNDSWTGYHIENVSYFHQLFKNQEFCNVYKQTYAKIRPTLLNKMKTYCEQIEEQYGTAFDESMKIHQTIYPSEGKNTLHSQLTELLVKLEKRLNGIDKLMERDFPATSITSISNNSHILQKRVNLSGQDYTKATYQALPKGIYIETYTDGKKQKYIKQK